MVTPACTRNNLANPGPAANIFSNVSWLCESEDEMETYLSFSMWCVCVEGWGGSQIRHKSRLWVQQTVTGGSAQKAGKPWPRVKSRQEDRGVRHESVATCRAVLLPPNLMQLLFFSCPPARLPSFQPFSLPCEAPDAPLLCRPLHSGRGEVQRSGETWIGGRGKVSSKRLRFSEVHLQSLLSLVSSTGLFWQNW